MDVGEGTDPIKILGPKFKPVAFHEACVERIQSKEFADKMYWHIVIYREENIYTFRRKKGKKPIDLTPNVLMEDLKLFL